MMNGARLFGAVPFRNLLTMAQSIALQHDLRNGILRARCGRVEQGPRYLRRRFFNWTTLSDKGVTIWSTTAANFIRASRFCSI